MMYHLLKRKRICSIKQANVLKNISLANHFQIKSGVLSHKYFSSTDHQNKETEISQKLGKTLDIFKVLNSEYPNLSKVSLLNKSYDSDNNLKSCLVKLSFTKTDLSSYETKVHSNLYSVDLISNLSTKLNSIPIDEEFDKTIMAKFEKNGKRVIFKANNNQLALELWNSQGFQYLINIKDCSRIYNNSVFGSISWSKQEDKIVFVAERQEIKNYTPYFCENTNQNGIPRLDKYNYGHHNSNISADFGELLTGFKYPIICVVDLINKNSIVFDLGRIISKKLRNTEEFNNLYPACPIFDENATGIIFHGYHFPVEKLGLAYCLNRHTKLLHIQNYEDLDKNYTSLNSDFKYSINNLCKDYYFAGFPKFSNDYKHLVYIGRKDEFHTHASYYSVSTLRKDEKNKVNLK